MCDYLGDLSARDTVILGRLKMIGQRAVRYTLTDKRCNGDDTAVAETELVGAAPYLAEEHIVVELSEFRRELS